MWHTALLKKNSLNRRLTFWQIRRDYSESDWIAHCTVIFGAGLFKKHVKSSFCQIHRSKGDWNCCVCGAKSCSDIQNTSVRKSWPFSQKLVKSSSLKLLKQKLSLMSWNLTSTPPTSTNRSWWLPKLSADFKTFRHYFCFHSAESWNAEYLFEKACQQRKVKIWFWTISEFVETYLPWTVNEIIVPIKNSKSVIYSVVSLSVIILPRGRSL